MARAKQADVRIEDNCDSYDRFGVYEYSTYPRGSVLAGQQCRKWLDDFNTLEEATAAYPHATPDYEAPSLNHLPDDTDY